MSLWDEVSHHYQDYEPPYEPDTLTDQHTATKWHDCAACGGLIMPGQRYDKAVWREEDGRWCMTKTHVDEEFCRSTRQTRRAWLDAQDYSANPVPF